MPIEQRVLRKANDNMRYICGTGRGSAQIELAVPNAPFQKVDQEFLSMTKAFFHELAS
jgi:hypothetical protein